jgi:hypothetical protein
VIYARWSASITTLGHNLITEKNMYRGVGDLLPLNDTRYNLKKGGINGRERVHAGTNYQSGHSTEEITKEKGGFIPEVSLFADSRGVFIISSYPWLKR